MRRQAFVLIGSAILLLMTVAPAWAQETIEYYGVDVTGSVRVVFDAGARWWRGTTTSRSGRR
jgi:hypothetical protein